MKHYILILSLIVTTAYTAMAQDRVVLAQAHENTEAKLKARTGLRAEDRAHGELNAQLQSTNIEMVEVQGGTFLMGSKEPTDDASPVHTVRLNTFHLGKYEVTQGQWRAVMHKNSAHFIHCDNCPVENVSWNEIQEFIKKLNEQTGQHYRLPTEAEWEYAAKGGNKSQHYKYSGSDDLDAVSWNAMNSNNKPHPVGQKKANELGIYDMTGNVWEWCSDWFDANYYRNTAYENPKGPNSGKAKVLRGGAWGFKAPYCTTSYRSLITPDYQSSLFGFRLARD
ncbi:MAG: formylglycine-generating enzyme family protein [Bacteroidota bacterium]